MLIIDKKTTIEPKDLLAVQRVVIRLINTSISIIFLGFVIEKLEFFLYIFKLHFQNGHFSTHPKLLHFGYYNYLGISIVIAGILLSVFSYRYYISWIKHLNTQKMDREKNVYLLISFFIVFIGIIMIVSMIFI